MRVAGCQLRVTSCLFRAELATRNWQLLYIYRSSIVKIRSVNSSLQANL